MLGLIAPSSLFLTVPEIYLLKEMTSTILVHLTIVENGEGVVDFGHGEPPMLSFMEINFKMLMVLQIPQDVILILTVMM